MSRSTRVGPRVRCPAARAARASSLPRPAGRPPPAQPTRGFPHVRLAPLLTSASRFHLRPLPRPTRSAGDSAAECGIHCCAPPTPSQLALPVRSTQSTLHPPGRESKPLMAPLARTARQGVPALGERCCFPEAKLGDLGGGLPCVGLASTALSASALSGISGLWPRWGAERVTPPSPGLIFRVDEEGQEITDLRVGDASGFQICKRRKNL